MLSYRNEVFPVRQHIYYTDTTSKQHFIPVRQHILYWHTTSKQHFIPVRQHILYWHTVSVYYMGCLTGMKCCFDVVCQYNIYVVLQEWSVVLMSCISIIYVVLQEWSVVLMSCEHFITVQQHIYHTDTQHHTNTSCKTTYITLTRHQNNTSFL
jgi:hypothetical protein